MIDRRLAPVLLAIVALSGCRLGPGKPDPSYQKARSLYQTLYLAELDDAYGDARMDEVVALLKQVDSGSSDASASKSMLDAIQHGREAYAARKPSRDKFAAAAAVPPKLPDIDPVKVLAASAKAYAQPAAGPPPPDSFGPGASIADINRSTGGCLVSGEPFKEQVTNKTGVIYRLSSAPQCAQALPGFVQQAVLAVDGSIYRRIDASEVSPPLPQPRGAAPPQEGPAAGAPRAGTSQAAAGGPPASADPSAPAGDQGAAGRPAAPDAGY